jgi:putative transposase
MSSRQSPGGRRVDRAQEIGLFRYALIREAADPGLSPRERGVLVRAMAGAEHTGPFGTRVQVSRVTLDRWIRAWRAGGFEALVPPPRGAKPRTRAATLELAVALKRENPARTAAQVAVILAAHGTDTPSQRTLQRLFARLELNTRPDGKPPRVFGRFEAEAPNVRWTGDALHGPVIGGRKAFLMAFIDDHSRAFTGYRWAHAEDTLALQNALRVGLSARGIPSVLYLDNGSAMSSGQLARALAVLGIRLAHSKPGQPAGRGKIERVFRTVREQFLVELNTQDTAARVSGLDELNAMFTAWVETVYHPRVHSETGQPPLERFLAGGPPTLPTPAQLSEAFAWSHERVVTKTATISLHGNTYQVDPALTGRRVELVFDPLDLTELAVRYQGRDMGKAVPFRITRHVHPDAGASTPPPAAPTGIDYLNLIATTHQRQLAAITIDYDRLTTSTSRARPGPVADPTTEPGGQLPGQLDLTELVDVTETNRAGGLS